jgi:ubiquinone/menaquinone biosynthesis C-methylase UbiE
MSTGCHPVSETRRLAAQASVGWPKQAQFLLSHGLPTSGRVLEVGCGPGFVTQLLRQLVPACRITAVDSDAMMVQRARTLLTSADTTELAHASVLALPFAVASFAAVLVRLVLQHLTEPGRALAEIHRVLRTGGRLLVVDVDDALNVATDPEVPTLTRSAEDWQAYRWIAGGIGPSDGICPASSVKKDLSTSTWT